MKSWFVALLVASASVAGCTDDKSGSNGSSLADAERAAANLDVEATATTGVIRGVVVDEALRPLGGVFIAVQSMDVNATSSTEGAFAFEGLEAGTYFLQASLQNYTTVQQSADVIAGVGNPEAIKILLAAIPRQSPYIEALQATLFVDIGVGSAPTDNSLSVSGLLSDNGLRFSREIQDNATIAQTEIVWTPTTPLANEVLFQGGTFDGGTSTSDRIHWQEKSGTSPVIFRSNATDEDGVMADRVSFAAFAWGPVGVMVNQQMDVFIHVFHGFEPSPDWQFGRDGDHPVPGG